MNGARRFPESGLEIAPGLRIFVNSRQEGFYAGAKYVSFGDHRPKEGVHASYLAKKTSPTAPGPEMPMTEKVPLS